VAVQGNIRIQVAGRTDVGLIREHNEDNFLIVDLVAAADAGGAPSGPFAAIDHREIELAAPQCALLIVCDGMGGAAAGEVASSMAIETVSSLMIAPPEGGSDGADERTAFARRLRGAAFAANNRIHQASVSDEARAGMGTTMTGVGVVGNDLVMAQVGDSRAYVLRDHRLVQVTRDQSLVNQLLETGQITEEQARMFEHSNVILQALGVQEEVEVLLSTVPLRRGDRLIVCTDGLTGVVTDEELLATLDGEENMEAASRKLVEMARAAGGPDNITVVTATFDGEGLPLPRGDELVSYARWFLDEPEPPPPEPSTPASWDEASGFDRRRRLDPAKTFLSLMFLLFLGVGGIVAAKELRRAGSVVRCRIVAAPELSVRIDGRDVGLRTRGRAGLELKLPPGRHRVGLRGEGAPPDERAVEVKAGEACQVVFDDSQ
jgi:protein phosphatase